MSGDNCFDFDNPLDKFIVLDIETTGINCNSDRIIEISAARYEHFQEVSVFSTLVNPQKPLPDFISRLTGISQNDLQFAPTWISIQRDFLDFIGDLPLIGHNIRSFDLRFIEKAIGYELDSPVIDTLDISRHAFPELSSHKLSYLNSALGIGTQTSHRALDDVRTTFAVLVASLYELAHEGSVPITDCVCEQAQSQPERKLNNPPTRKHWEHVDIKSITPTCAEIDASCPLCGKSIVFTGTLSLPRENAMQIAVNAGAVIKSSVSKKTDYLVIGAQDKDIVGVDGFSSKEEKAIALNQSGKANIKMISEYEFLALAQQKEIHA